MKQMKFGVLGFGNMGSAIVKGAVNKGVLKAQDVCVYDPKDSAASAAEDFGLELKGSVKELAEASDIILLAVKPQQYVQTCTEAEGAMDGKAVFSIVAGTSVEKLQLAIKGVPRILRIMPNTPALVFEGAFALCSENDLKDEEKEFAQKLFTSIGIVEWVKEYDIDAFCGLSGGGPAYVAMFIEALADGGVKEGLTRDVAYKLAVQTVLGSAKLIMEKGMHPGALKDMVTSPAGTTIEGTEALEAGAFRYSVMQAVVQATERSREL